MKDRKTLVPLDGSPLSAKTIKSLISLKGNVENISIPLTLLHILDISMISYRGFAELTSSEIEESAREKARQFIAEQKQLFETLPARIQQASNDIETLYSDFLSAIQEPVQSGAVSMFTAGFVFEDTVLANPLCFQCFDLNIQLLLAGRYTHIS